jgi:hypothetical protein
MTDPAQFVLRDSTGWRLYYSPRAQDMNRTFFWGAVEALEAVADATPWDGWWIDPAQCWGGAHIDTEAQRLMMFGGNESLHFEIAYRRVWRALAEVMWGGWQFEWCPYGIDDIVDALGEPRVPLPPPVAAEAAFARVGQPR